MGPGAAFAHLLGGAVLVLSFGLLSQRRLAAVITMYALQGWALAAAAGWQGWLLGAPALGVTGLIVLGATGVAAPVLLRRIVRRSRLRQVADTALGIFPGMAIGSALVALAVLVVLPATMDSPVLPREDLALALSVVLLGLLMMIARRNALAQMVGFMSMGNGLVLGAVSVRGMPLVVAATVAVLALAGAAVSGGLFFGIGERFDRTGGSPR